MSKFNKQLDIDKAIKEGKPIPQEGLGINNRYKPKLSRHERIQVNRAKFLATKEAQIEDCIDDMVDRATTSQDQNDVISDNGIALGMSNQASGSNNLLEAVVEDEEEQKAPMNESLTSCTL